MFSLYFSVLFITLLLTKFIIITMRNILSEYNENRNNAKKNSYLELFWIRHYFEIEHEFLSTKCRYILSYQSTNLLKIWSVFLFLLNENKSQTLQEFKLHLFTNKNTFQIARRFNAAVLFHWLLETHNYIK